jgi:2-methylaconitate cis-trans-isomerase PrpF
MVSVFQGMVEATGTYAELHDSGLNFAKQLGVEVETENSQGEHPGDSELSTASHSNSDLSLRITKHQGSETSECVSVFTVKSRGP